MMTRDEAIENIKKALPLNDTLAEAFYTLHPELAESEDERTRKEIIDYLGLVGKGKDDYRQPMIDRWIAYLEKQKEPHYTKRNALFDKCVKNCDPAIMKKVSDEVDEMLQKEQETVESDKTALTEWEEVLNTFLFTFAHSTIEDCEPKEYIKKYSSEILKAAYKELNAQLKQDIFEAQQEGRREGYEAAKSEQNPAEWSEEDEKIINDACCFLGEYAGYIGSKNWGKSSTLFCIVDKLKSLRPQSKVEWSEEDEAMLEDIIDDYDNGEIMGDDTEKVMWLKSLRPQPHWKPSEKLIGRLPSRDEIRKEERI